MPFNTCYFVLQRTLHYITFATDSAIVITQWISLFPGEEEIFRVTMLNSDTVIIVDL
jgi:hypothetical protein